MFTHKANFTAVPLELTLVYFIYKLFLHVYLKLRASTRRPDARGHLVYAKGSLVSLEYVMISVPWLPRLSRDPI